MSSSAVRPSPARVPVRIRRVLDRLAGAGHQAYLVGGCVRDLLLERRPADWDIATDARPEQVIALFPGARARGRFGTVVLPRASIEVTTFRTEGPYSDRRRPDRVEYVTSIEADLARRDFTCNALALAPGGRLIDPFGGLADLRARRLRAVGDPHERFSEDALRLLRAVRFAAQLGFTLEEATAAAVSRDARLLAAIAPERVRDEFLKILLSPRPAHGLELSRALGLLAVFLPELAALPAAAWDRAIGGVQFAPEDATLRLAVLLHGLGPEAAAAALRRLRFPNDTVETVRALLTHLPALGSLAAGDAAGAGGGGGDAAWRRLFAAAGRDRVRPLIEVWAATAGPSAQPGFGERAAALRGRAEAILASGAPLGVAELAVGGREVMAAAGLAPGPAVGRVLARLLEEVLADPARNTREHLLARASALAGAARGGPPADPGGGAGKPPARREHFPRNPEKA